MRENRTYGSEGGETGKPVFPTPIKGDPVASEDPRHQHTHPVGRELTGPVEPFNVAIHVQAVAAARHMVERCGAAAPATPWAAKPSSATSKPSSAVS